jgi:hypothetical protein
MARWALATLLLLVSIDLLACPLCMGSGRLSKAQQLVELPQSVLAVPTADAGRYRVVEIIKGGQPAGSTIEAGRSRSDAGSELPGSGRGKPRLLVRDEAWPMWIVAGAIGIEHADWLRKLAAGKRPAETNADAWRARVALVLPYLEHPEPLAAEIAYGEFAGAPYSAMLTAKSHLDLPAIRRWLLDPTLAARRPLYILLLGMRGNAQDAVRLEQRLEAAWQAGDATNLGPLIAADLQLRGSTRMAWVEEKYLADRSRSTKEIEGALLALSVHGNANGPIPRERVIHSYRVFMKAHREIAGYVAQDLAAWQYWDAVPEYVALMKSDVRQQYASRVAMLAYLGQSPVAEAREIARR